MLDNTPEEGGYKQKDVKEGLMGRVAPEPREEESPGQQFRHLPTYERLRRMREEQERRTKEARERQEAKRQELERQQIMKQQPQMQQPQMQPIHQVRSTHAQKIQYQQHRM